MSIHAGYSELIKAYRQHQQAAGTVDTPSQRLLYFYAVECGLKHVYLRHNSLKDTAQLPLPLLTHDLGNLVKELRVAANTAGALPYFQLQRDHTHHPLSVAHEAWRYGIVIQPADEEELVRWLQKMVEWIQGEI